MFAASPFARTRAQRTAASARGAKQAKKPQLV